jgi:hypothetical protein
MRNKIEILRAIEFTKDDLDNISNLDDLVSFSDKEKEFMESFKKVYELGLNQLELFINKLDEEGSELDDYSIQYYVSQLLTGPLGQYARKLSEGKKFFAKVPNILGTNGNIETTALNTAIIPKTTPPFGVKVETYNKLPIFLQNQITSSVSKSEEVFRDGMKSAIFMDNTLQIMDKNPQLRYDTEPSGEWQKKSHGSYCVGDVGFRNILIEINPLIFEKVKEYLGEDDFRLFIDNKTYNPFDAEKNTSSSSNYVFKRILREGDDIEEEVDTDILGDINDSFDRRESVLKVDNGDKNVEYELNTNQGQLGIQ